MFAYFYTFLSFLFISFIFLPSRKSGKMLQTKEIILSNKHTGFEQLSLFKYVSSLPKMADFFFALKETPDSETNDNVFLSIFIKVGFLPTFFLFQL